MQQAPRLHTCTRCGHAVSVKGGDMLAELMYAKQGHLTSDRPDLHPVHDPEGDVTLTMRCSPCRELVDVCIVRDCGARPATDPYHAKPGEKMDCRTRYPKRRRKEYPPLACPICHGTRLSVWDPEHGCPKCGGSMQVKGEPASIATDVIL